MLAEIKEIVRFLEKKEEGYEWDVRDTLGRLWRNLYAHTKPVEGGNSRKTMDAQRLKSMLELIQKEYNEPLDLADVYKRQAVDRRKQAHIIETALAYLAETGDADRDCRFDVAEILEEDGKKYFRYIENAFEA